MVPLGASAQGRTSGSMPLLRVIGFAKESSDKSEENVGENRDECDVEKF